MTGLFHTEKGYITNFNSHPHEEDDAILFIIQIAMYYFNSHPHEEDDGFILTVNPGLTLFQLTSSRRG